MPSLYVATNGLSVWNSEDLGETIGRMPSSTGLYSGSQVWSLATHPIEAGVLLCGTDSGVYRLAAPSGNWEHIGSPIENGLVTALAFDPGRPATIVAGTQPGGLYRSDDAGATWRHVEVGIKPYVTSGFYAGDKAADTATEEADSVKHWTRVTDIVFHPGDSRIVLASVEIDGIWRSLDGGHSWVRVSEGLVTEDIHGFTIVRNGSSDLRLFATTCDGIHMSTDVGLTWKLGKIDSPWQYTRSMRQRTDGSGVVFVTNGNGPPGSSGRLLRSRDFGSTWENVPLPVQVESSMYFMATHPADPGLIFAATNLGQIFRSRDGGETWSVIPRRLPEVRAIAWLPR